jgi:acyl carrier protein
VSSSNLTPPSPTLERIEHVVESLLGAHDLALTADTRPADVPGWDSLATVNIIFGVEEEFGIRLADDDLTSFETVGQLGDRVERALGAQGKS